MHLTGYKGVVIDGTSCGIFSDLPNYHRDNFYLTAPKNIGRKFLITVRKEKRVRKAFLDLADRHSKWMMRDYANSAIHFFLQPKNGGIETRDMPFIRLLFRDSSCGCGNIVPQNIWKLPQNDSLHSVQFPYSRFASDTRLRVISENLCIIFKFSLRNQDGDVVESSQSESDSEEDNSVPVDHESDSDAATDFKEHTNSTSPFQTTVNGNSATLLQPA